MFQTLVSKNKNMQKCSLLNVPMQASAPLSPSIHHLIFQKAGLSTLLPTSSLAHLLDPHSVIPTLNTIAILINVPWKSMAMHI